MILVKKICRVQVLSRVRIARRAERVEMCWKLSSSNLMHHAARVFAF